MYIAIYVWKIFIEHVKSHISCCKVFYLLTAICSLSEFMAYNVLYIASKKKIKALRNLVIGLDGTVRGRAAIQCSRKLHPERIDYIAFIWAERTHCH